MHPVRFDSARWRARRPRLGKNAGLLMMTLVLLFCAPALRPAPARAGTYDVYSCTQPNGAAAPIDGWTPTANSEDVEMVDECGEGGTMWAAVLGDRATPPGAEAVWSFVPSPGTTIREATLYRVFNNSDNQDVDNAFTFERLVAPYRFSTPFERCGESTAYHYECALAGQYPLRSSPETEVKVPSKDLEPGPNGPAAGIYMSVGCMGVQESVEEHCNGGSPGPIAYAGLAGATITLEDDSPPRVSAIGGTLTTGTELEGEQNLAITGTDTGSGIYQAILEVDGQPVQTTTVDNNDGHCENVGQTTDGRPAFLYTVPCALEVNDQYVFFDMAGISDGPHRLTVLVTDAAGNATTVLNREVVVGRGACNGTCDDQAKLVASDEKLLKPVTRRYSKSGLSLSGVLREPAGTAVPDARLEVLQQPSYTGAPLKVVGSTTTNAAGEWQFAVPRGPSRALLVAWRSHALDSGYAAQLEYHEKVFADLALSAPRRVRAGVPFRFRGQLIGGYVPPERSLIEMEIFFLGRWRTIETLRTDSRGGFAYKYTFSPEVADRASYLFRAVIEYSRAYPFLAAASAPVRVRVG